MSNSVMHFDLMNGSPYALLIPHPSSYPFNDRKLSLKLEQKIGRLMGRENPSEYNAIFDCKVLSRNHAVIWHDNGRFFIGDTQSSNGTFINNESLTKDTSPREVYSGDVVQFGINVTENSCTHGCIIAILKLYLSDGTEAKVSPSASRHKDGNGIMITLQDLYFLNQSVRDALAREQLFESKLDAVLNALKSLKSSINCSWKPMIEEDRILTRIEVLEDQLVLCSKKFSHENGNNELLTLGDSKELYQTETKKALKLYSNENCDLMKQLKNSEANFHTLKNELDMVHALYDKGVSDNAALVELVAQLTKELNFIKTSNEKVDAATTVSPEQKSISVNTTITDEAYSCSLETKVNEIEELKTKLAELELIRAEYNNKKQDLIETELNLNKATIKIAKLLLVKDKYLKLSKETQYFSSKPVAAYHFMPIICTSIIVVFFSYIVSLFSKN